MDGWRRDRDFNRTLIKLLRELRVLRAKYFLKNYKYGGRLNPQYFIE